MEKITTCLWFDRNAEEAANFYVSTFKNSSIVSVNRYREGSQHPAGTVMTVDFMLDGRKFLGLNGGPHFSFTPAISFVVHCETQEEVDDMWQKLSAGGTENQCGWLSDKFGVSWQIVPNALIKFLTSSDVAASQRAFAAMMTMTKINIAQLEQAYNNVG